MPPDRARLQHIANETLQVLESQKIYNHYNHSFYDLSPSIHHLLSHTKVYKPHDHWLSGWASSRGNVMQDGAKVRVDFGKKTTLEGVGMVYQQYAQQLQRGGKVGVLNFASATTPGGGWRNGASAQEESVARSSTLPLSLEKTAEARVFYDTHGRDGGLKGGFYSHAMIYSPRVTIFRGDSGEWIWPMEVGVVTSPAVNAKEVRRRSPHQYDRNLEHKIEAVMKERMGRILALFEMHCYTDLVLGAFGTGVFQNDLEMVAKIWRELLVDKGARFRYSFKSVYFAIPDERTRQRFEDTFWRKDSGSEGRKLQGHRNG